IRDFHVTGVQTCALPIYVVKGVSTGLGMILAHFSHFYHTGANIYFSIVAHAGIKPSAVEQYDSIWEKILEAAYDAGATLSHHHEIGRASGRERVSIAGGR